MDSDDEELDAEITDVEKPQGFCNKELVISLLTIVVLSVIHGAVESQTEGWDFLTSAYFTVQVFTTIGYGDITPKSVFGRLFTSFFILACLIVISYIINNLVSTVMDAQESCLSSTFEKAREIGFDQAHAQEQAAKKRKALIQFAATSALFVGFILFGTIFYSNAENCTCSYGVTEISNCTDTSYEVCEPTGQLKDFVGAFYFSVVTLTTVGFGDLTTASFPGRIVGLFWMVFGVCVTGTWIGAVQNMVFANDTERHETPKHKLGDTLFEKFDKDGDGKLNKAEYLAYELAQHKFVPMPILQTLMSDFDAMNTQDGLASFDEITGKLGTPYQ
jgi:hypothetical protein